MFRADLVEQGQRRMVCGKDNTTTTESQGSQVLTRLSPCVDIGMLDAAALLCHSRGIAFSVSETGQVFSRKRKSFAFRFIDRKRSNFYNTKKRLIQSPVKTRLRLQEVGHKLQRTPPN
jgi:hypothetical protein